MVTPTLRELVDMLPGEMRQHLPCRWDDLCWSSEADGAPISESHAEALVGWYLVRWLGERDCYIYPTEDTPRMYRMAGHVYPSFVSSGPYPTPLEAAVRAVGAICQTQ